MRRSFLVLVLIFAFTLGVTDSAEAILTCTWSVSDVRLDANNGDVFAKVSDETHEKVRAFCSLGRDIVNDTVPSRVVTPDRCAYIHQALLAAQLSQLRIQVQYSDDVITDTGQTALSCGEVAKWNIDVAKSIRNVALVE